MGQMSYAFRYRSTRFGDKRPVILGFHSAKSHLTAPHRTAPHRTAPHRTAPHRTAPHRVDCHKIKTLKKTEGRQSHIIYATVQVRCGAVRFLAVFIEPHGTVRFSATTHRTVGRSTTKSPRHAAPCDSQILQSAPHRVLVRGFC